MTYIFKKMFNSSSLEVKLIPVIHQSPTKWFPFLIFLVILRIILIGTYSKVSNKQIFKKICFCGIIGCCEFIKSLSSQNSQLSKVETEVRTSSLARILQCFPQPFAFILSCALTISALCTYSILYAYYISRVYYYILKNTK